MPWKIQPSIADPDSTKSVNISTIAVNNVIIEEVVDDHFYDTHPGKKVIFQ